LSSAMFATGRELSPEAAAARIIAMIVAEVVNTRRTAGTALGAEATAPSIHVIAIMFVPLSLCLPVLFFWKGWISD